MEFFCGCVTINHKKYRMYFNYDQQIFVFYKLIHGELCPIESTKIYTNKHNFSYLEQGFFPELSEPYRVRKNPFNKKQEVEYLTQETYDILLTALDRNPWLNTEQKEILTWFQSLLTHYPCNLKDLYNLYASLRIIKRDLSKNYTGLYNSIKNILLLNLKYQEYQTLTSIHELTHMHQTIDKSYLFEWFIEGMTEIITYELSKEYIDDIDSINAFYSNKGYDYEINICRILCELFDSNKLCELTLNGEERDIENYFKTYLSYHEFYELFGKMALYFNRISINHLDIDNLMFDVDHLLLKITDRRYPIDCEAKNHIYTYLTMETLDSTIHLKNYTIPEKQYKKCK